MQAEKGWEGAWNKRLHYLDSTDATLVQQGIAADELFRKHRTDRSWKNVFQIQGRMMTFKNEYVLPVEQETSDFLKKARETLHVGHSKYDAWTVDRQRDIVLLYKGTGRDVESSREEWWTYLDRTDKYSVDTDLLSNVEAPAQEVAITRVFRACFSSSGEAVTDLRIIGLIKEAIQEYSRSFLFNLDHFKRCQLTLIDARTGKEI